MNINVSRQAAIMPMRGPVAAQVRQSAMPASVSKAPSLLHPKEVHQLMSHSKGQMGGIGFKAPPSFLLDGDTMGMQAKQSSGKKMSTTQKALLYGLGGALKIALEVAGGGF